MNELFSLPNSIALVITTVLLWITYKEEKDYKAFRKEMEDYNKSILTLGKTDTEEKEDVHKKEMKI